MASLLVMLVLTAAPDACREHFIDCFKAATTPSGRRAVVAAAAAQLHGALADDAREALSYAALDDAPPVRAAALDALELKAGDWPTRATLTSLLRALHLPVGVTGDDCHVDAQSRIVCSVGRCQKACLHAQAHVVVERRPSASAWAVVESTASLTDDGACGCCL